MALSTTLARANGESSTAPCLQGLCYILIVLVRCTVIVRPEGVPPVSPSRRRDSVELGSPVKIPAITSNLGGARALNQNQQDHLYFNYPPENINREDQATHISPQVGAALPRSTTYGFGYNFERARDNAPMAHKGIKPRWRPQALPGEVPRGRLGVAPFV